MQEPAFAPVPGHILRDLDESRHYNDWLFDRARPRLGRRVLDAGAGVGAFTALAAAAGATVVALEPDPVFVAGLRRRFAGDERVAVVEGTAEAPEVSDDFDSVLCLNVLEHILEDAAALAAFRDRLVPGGRLLLLTPAHPSLLGAYDRSVGHHRRYKRSELRDLLEQAGFAVEELRYVNPLGALGWLVSVRLRRSPEWPSRSFRTFDRLVPVLRRLDRLRLPFGLSLWAVARRPT